MKRLAALVLLSGAMLLSTGCVQARLGRNEFGDTPAYSFRERADQIARNWDMEGKMIQDDIDHLLLLRPVSQLSIWKVR